MNNVIRFSAAVDYPELDIATFRQSALTAGDAVIEVRRLFTQTNYLPHLHTSVVEVDKAMRDAAFKLREMATYTDTKLQIKTTTLKGYQDELEGASEADREEILEDIASQAADIKALVKRQGHTLLKLLDPIKQPVDRLASRLYLGQLEKEKEGLPSEILDIQNRQDALKQQRQTLSEAMGLIEAKSFNQVAKDTMLNAQEISKLAMAGPEVAVVEKAIELAQQLMAKVEQVINYAELMAARDKVRKQMDDLIARAHDKTGELRMTGMKIDLITRCHTFDDSRNGYVGEFEKVTAATQSFLGVHNAVNAENPSAVSAFVDDALALADYLKIVR